MFDKGPEQVGRPFPVSSDSFSPLGFVPLSVGCGLFLCIPRLLPAAANPDWLPPNQPNKN